MTSEILQVCPAQDNLQQSKAFLHQDMWLAHSFCIHWIYNHHKTSKYNHSCCKVIILFGDMTKEILECGPMPNVMAALPNIGGALCSTLQSLADAHY